jgi:hypothetical protein
VPPISSRKKQTSPRSQVRADLAKIGERFAAADSRAKRAARIPDREAAEAERREAEGEFWAAGLDLADLLLLLLRYALQHRPDALRMYLAEALRSELEPIVESLAKLESRK